MGYMRHHAIIVTSWNEKNLFKVHIKARRIFGDDLVSNIVKSLINDYQSFFIAPDGSKEGWEDSDIGDMKREAFIKSLDNFRYEDGSSPLDWVEVQYGDDWNETIIVNHSDEGERKKKGESE